MYKLKTHSGASKRFKITASGKIKRKHAFKNHILTKKSAQRKRHLRKAAYLSPANEYTIFTMINR